MEAKTLENWYQTAFYDAIYFEHSLQFEEYKIKLNCWNARCVYVKFYCISFSIFPGCLNKYDLKFYVENRHYYWLGEFSACIQRGSTRVGCGCGPNLISVVDSVIYFKSHDWTAQHRILNSNGRIEHFSVIRFNGLIVKLSSFLGILILSFWQILAFQPKTSTFLFKRSDVEITACGHKKQFSAEFSWKDRANLWKTLSLLSSPLEPNSSLNNSNS